MIIAILLPTEAANKGVLCKKVFLEILQNSLENTCAKVSFLIKLQACRCFSVNFVKFLRPLFLQNTSGDCFYTQPVSDDTSSPYLPVFGLNIEIYSVNIHIQSEYRKIRTRNNSVLFTQWQLYVALLVLLPLKTCQLAKLIIELKQNCVIFQMPHASHRKCDMRLINKHTRFVNQKAKVSTQQMGQVRALS